jgi:Acyl-CoA thioesterase C-terminal domain/Acyl-CoA thioesterase N-terminal domain
VNGRGTVSDECLFVAEGDGFQPTGWAVGPWSADTLQGSAYGGLLARAIERNDATSGMTPARLSFDLWRPVTRERLACAVTVLRDGRKARTVEASLVQAGRPVARCTAVLLKMDLACTLPRAPAGAPALGPEAGRPVPARVKAWSPFFTSVDTRVVEGDLLARGPAAAWFHLGRRLVAGEETSPLVHAVSAADLASGISAVVDLRRWSFINADLTVVLWRTPRPPWILLAAETHVGDQGTGIAHGLLSDLDGPFARCEQTLLFERRP